jgi:nucleotide-binding universal stress UspA family protein
MKALWLVDVLDKDVKSPKAIANTLQGLGFGPTDQIWCTYMSQEIEGDLNFATGLATDEAQSNRLRRLPTSVLKKHISKLETQGLSVRPSVISVSGISLKSGADRIVMDAKAKKVDLIALQTHGRKGFVRFVMGSFAETLIHRSPISLLILNPNTKAKKNVKRILYATELERAAEKSVVQVAEFAKRAGAELRLVHVPFPSYAVKFKGQDPQVETYRKNVPKQMERLTKLASAVGVVTDYVIANPNKPTVEVIDEEAKNFRADLTAVKSKAGPIGTLFLGSVARSLVRQSSRPVLILRH